VPSRETARVQEALLRALAGSTDTIATIVNLRADGFPADRPTLERVIRSTQDDIIAAHGNEPPTSRAP